MNDDVFVAASDDMKAVVHASVGNANGAPYDGEGMSDAALMDGMARDLQTVKAECLRLASIVEAVRAFPMSPQDTPAGYQRRETLAYERGYADGVEALQALLDGER